MKNLFLDCIKTYFLTFLPLQKGLSVDTIQSYKDTMNIFVDYIMEVNEMKFIDLSFNLIDEKLISDFLLWLQTNRNNGISTRNLRLTILRTFFKYSAFYDLSNAFLYSNVCQIPMMKTITIQVDFFSEGALKTILAQPDVNKVKGIRNLTFMIFMYDTAARDREVLDLKLCDLKIDTESPYVILHGKGRKIRTVPVMDKTVRFLKKYLKLFHPNSDENEYVFYTIIHKIHNQMSDDCVGKFMRKYGEKACVINKQVPLKLHPHQFRHSRAMHLYRSGMPLPLLAEFLGHSNLETTMIYAYADIEMKRKSINNVTHGDDIPAIWKSDDELLKKLCGLK